MVHANIRNKILHHFQGKRRNQYQSDEASERLFQKLTPQMMVVLLEDASTRPFGQTIPGEPLADSRKYKSKKLLDDMENKTWRIMAAPHEGGLGDAKRPPDMNLHITLRVGDDSYHLRCKEEPTLHIIQITA